MASTQDCSIGIAVESTYKTYVAPTRWYEFLDESFDWTKQVKQGMGLRVGARVDRSARRVVPAADGNGDMTIEACSKGMGLLWQACLGAGTSTLVAGSTYQQNFTIGDAPSSLSVQKGLVEAGGTVDAYSFLGSMVTQWEFAFPNNDIATLKASFDHGDLSTAQAYAAPSYPAAPVNLYHFANATLTTGALTAPTATALGSSATATVNVRSGSVQMNNNIRNDRFNAGGAGRKSKPLMGKRDITGSLQIEYDSTVYRDLVINDSPLTLVVNLTAGALSTGVETLQVILPEVKLNGTLPKANGTDLIVQDINFTCLDNLVAAQPIWVTMRTADTAL